jgi:hypothetical protein
MSSKLEKFIEQNRSGFDAERPSTGVWEKVEASLSAAKKESKVFCIRDIYKWTVAAAILCIVLTSVYFLYIHKQQPQTATQEPNKEIEDPGAKYPEYKTEINQAFNVILARQQELKKATAGNPELYQKFLGDLQVLDSTYGMLQKQASQTPNRDVILKAMIQNLQLQAELLYRQLIITNEIKKDGRQKNDPS